MVDLCCLRIYFSYRESPTNVLYTTPGGYSLLPYKSDGDARRKISRTPLKVSRILFYGRVPNSFPPLGRTNSTTTNYITGTTNFNSNKDNFQTLSSQEL